MRTLPLLLFAGACAVPAPLLPGHRLASSPTGSQLLPLLRGLPLAGREAVLQREFADGNLPPFLRELAPVERSAAIDGRQHKVRFWCTRDYLGFGDDGDWFRMPMTPTLAQQFADELDAVLPTRAMVDAIWAEAGVHLAPFPFHPSNHDILAVELFHEHHRQIERQRGPRPFDQLVAGCKKDVVVSPLLDAWPGRVCIYGWHHPDGKPIQPLSKVHTFAHVDYSHGIRLVARRCEVDGVPTTVDAVLADPVLHVLLSDEGPFTSWRYSAPAAQRSPDRRQP
jgi:hypothetical protein